VIADYIQAAIRAEPYWSYSQARPMSNLGRKPGDRQTADCSTFATTALYWARLQTGIAVPDPNGYGYNGYGFTGSLMSFNSARRVFNSSFEIGDLALYGPNSSPWSTTHVCICYRAGSGYTSLWGSHGSQSGPGSRTLHYRSDLIGVYRPELLPK
jgi:hypothetical protein